MRKLIVVIIGILIFNPAFCQTYGSNQECLKWWQAARFGMFIHWGPVSRIGKEISWSREKCGKSWYDSLYRGFNPAKPEEIYQMAKQLQPGIIIHNRLDVFHPDESHPTEKYCINSPKNQKI